MKLSEIEAATSRVEDGAWVRGLPSLPGVAVKVRGMDCMAADLLRKRLLLEMPEEQRRALSEEDRERVNIEVMAGAVLVDWNITDDAGGRLPCTADAARSALSDPKTRLLREGVAYASQVVAVVGVASLETDAKN